MLIMVEGVPAVIKAGSSFEFTEENPDFDGAGDYTLNIVFPIADCEQNQDIFGSIYRPDCDFGELVFSCDIMDSDFYKSGVLTVTKVSESEIECQFLSGKSKLNFKDELDEIYINEMEFDTAYINTERSTSRAEGESDDGYEEYIQSIVSLPWMYEESGVIFNIPGESTGGSSGSASAGASGVHQSTISWEGVSTDMIKLIYIAKKICEKIGYCHDFSSWENSDQEKIIICNALPLYFGEHDKAKILPHWTVKEFFSEVEQFLNGRFVFDHASKSIEFSFRDDVCGTSTEELIENVIDVMSIDISTEGVSYLDTDMLKFKHDDNVFWKMADCDWYIKSHQAEEYNTLSELVSDLEQRYKNTTTSDRPADWNSPEGIGNVYHAKDVDTYFAIMKYEKESVSLEEVHYKNRLVPINIFGSPNYTEDDKAKTRELKCIPVSIINTGDDYGQVMTLSPSAMADVTNFDESTGYVQPMACNSLLLGTDSGKSSEYYSVLNLAYWDGASAAPAGLAVPKINNIIIGDDWSYSVSAYSMRLNDASTGRKLFNIDTKKKYEFRFLSGKWPDVNAKFMIWGKPYICKSISAEVTEDGVSDLKKGEFYRIID